MEGLDLNSKPRAEFLSNIMQSLRFCNISLEVKECCAITVIV